MAKVCTARAPGKIILSGEHAVVHGGPALVTAVNRYLTATVSPSESGRDRIDMQGMSNAFECSRQDLLKMASDMEVRRDRFLAGEGTVRDMAPHPEWLLAYAAALALNRTGQTSADTFHLQLTSDIPLGSGMGSSAAAASALILALAEWLGHGSDPDRLYDWTLAVEQMQHGHPSGVDPAICVYGGTLRFERGRRTPLDIRVPPGRLVGTGTPESTTGECVEQVRRQFGASTLWGDFRRVTDGLAESASNGDAAAWCEGIRANHRLLVEIGVVPDRVQQFIDDVEADGGVAKICGAGSIRGDAAGMVMVYGGEDPEGICARFGYEMLDVKGGVPGVFLV